MTEKRLLILGSVEDFTGLTRYAVKRGIYTVVADAYQGEAKKYASKAYDVDLNDKDLIDLICKEEKIDHVISSFSDNLFEMMVYTCERNKIPCFCSASKVRYLRDKILMKDMLKELEIKTAEAQILDVNAVCPNIINVAYPCVVKPVDGWGSKYMRIVNDYSELLEYIINIPSSIGSVMLETINQGYEINVMSWIKDGKVYLIEFGDRETSGKTKKNLPYLSREVFPSFFYNDLQCIVVEYLMRIANYIGIKEGPLSMQFFYHNGEITVGEVAGRFFGLGQGVVPIINGIDLNELLINMLYFPDDNFSILKKTEKYPEHCSIAIYLKANRGIVRDLGNIENFNNTYVDEYRVFAEPNKSTVSIPWLARIYAHFKTREEADMYTRDLYESLFVPNIDGTNLVAKNKLVIYGEVNG